MMNVLIPSGLPRRIKSRKIVQLFTESGEDKAIVNIKQTGREKQNVYMALHQYLAKHPEFGVSVQLEDGDVVLYRSIA